MSTAGSDRSAAVRRSAYRLPLPAPLSASVQAVGAPFSSFAPARDAVVATLLLITTIALGSGGFASIDPALFGYLGAVLAATFGTVWRISAFWRRPASAFYARALFSALRRRRSLRRTAAFAGRDLVAQDFVRRRSARRWAAHMLLSLGVLVSFAITLPLVFGWMHFRPAGRDSYRMVVFTLPTIRFAVDGGFAWLLFHALSIAAVAVVIGAGYFLATRWRLRGLPGAVDRFAVAPLLLLLIVALTGLALPASRGWPLAFQLAAILHEVSVVVLLVALPFSKLSHVLLRPLQLGARAVRAAGVAQRHCDDCGAELAPDEQLRAVERLLARRGLALRQQVGRCQPCRRRQIAGVQAALIGADFQPHLAPRRRSQRAAPGPKDEGV